MGEIMAETPGKPLTADEEVASEIDVATLEVRIRELQAENDELRQQAIQPAGPSAEHTGRGRTGGAIALVVIAALLLALSVPAVWLNRMVTDTDVYVATVAPLAQDPDIQNAVAAAASDAVIEKVDAEARIKPLLPENLQIIAVPIAQAIDQFIVKQSQALVRSDKFAEIWATANRVSHKALVTAVTGRDTGAVGVQAGVITLDVGTLAEQIKARLQGAGLDFVANLPTGGIDKQIVLYDSPALAQMTSAFDLITRIALWLPLAALALIAGAIALAADRRKAILWLGATLTVAAILPLQALFLSQTYVSEQLNQLAAIPTPAAQSAFAIIFRDLVTASRAVIALGIVIWVGAILVGPARWAVAMRGGLSGGMSGVASHLELGRFGVWVRARKSALRIAGAAVALGVLVLLPAPRTVAAIVSLAIAYLVWLLLVGLLGADPVEPATEIATAPAPERVEDEVTE